MRWFRLINIDLPPPEPRPVPGPTHRSHPIQRIHRLIRLTRHQPAFGLRRQPELCRQAAEVTTQDGMVSVIAARYDALRVDSEPNGYVSIILSDTGITQATSRGVLVAIS